MDKALSKYLANYAEPESAASIDKCLHHGLYGHALIIPACAEGEELVECLRSIPTVQNPVLIIVIINGRSDADNHVAAQNQKSHDAIAREYGKAKGARDTNTFGYEHPAGTLCLIDCYSPGRRFEPKEGVGRARKLGSDIALRLWSEGKILSPYLHSSDADVGFPSDVFQQVLDASPNETASAILLPFSHEPQPDTSELRRASALYEISLRYYVLGLKSAQSPYAFHTIGSTIAVHALDYARVRGFPKREAGEDFYLLNKLAKVRPIRSSLGDPLKIQGRCSDRVPFGTGKRLIELCAHPDEDFLMYSPKTFAELKNLHQRTDTLFEVPHSIRNVLGSGEDLVLRECLENLQVIDGIDAAIERGNTPAQRQRNFHTYFDGFRSLKLIHALRGHSYPSVPFREALRAAAFIPAELSRIEDLDELRANLSQLELGA